MNFQAPGRSYGLRGASKREKTREEILQEAEKERVARRTAREQLKAAVKIQSTWRGFTSRVSTEHLLLAKWQSRFAGPAGRADACLTSNQLLQELVPLLLAALMPQWSKRTEQRLAWGTPLALGEGFLPEGAADPAAPEQQPQASKPWPQGVTRGRGTGGSASLLVDAAARGSILLLLRSMTCNDPDYNYCSAACSPDGKIAEAWKIQATLLAQLAASVIAGTETHGQQQQQQQLLDAAAARLLQLLLAPDLWKVAAGSPQATAAVAEVVQQLVGRPAPLLCAARRLLLREGGQPQQETLAAAAAEAGSTEGGVAGATTRLPSSMAAPGRPASAPGSGLPSVQRMLGLSVKLLEAAVLEGKQQQGGAICTSWFVQQLLTAPELFPQMAAAEQVRLCQPELLKQLLQAAGSEAAAGKLVSGPALFCFSNLVQLMAHRSQRGAWCAAGVGGSSGEATCGGGSWSSSNGGSGVDAVGARAASSGFSNPDLSRSYCLAATHLLAAAAKGRAPVAAAGEGRSSGTGGLGFWLGQQVEVVSSQSQLLQLMKVMGQRPQQQQQQQQEGLDSLARPDGDEGMVVFSAYCLHLVEDLSVALAACHQSSQPEASSSATLSSPVLNTLAFAPALLPALWRWLSLTVGLPLEAPLEASLGLDVAALADGCRGFDPGHALVMGLFCRAYCQLLLVLEDGDLHTKQQPFTTAATRAIGTSLNTLVFHTYLPQGTSQQQQQQQGRRGCKGSSTLRPETVSRGKVLLEQYAPMALRGLYERDARKSFCQPALWTAPYSNWQRKANGQAPAPAAAASATVPNHSSSSSSRGPAGSRTLPFISAVVQSLVTGPIEAATAALTGANPSTAGAAAGAGPGSRGAPNPGGVLGARPAALVGLLRAAPQAIPFEVRLDLFRQMLQEDKARGRWHLAPVEGGPRPIKLVIRRQQLLEDAFVALSGKGANIKAKLQVTFVNSQGLEEAGIDHGGLQKELLEQVTALGCQMDYGLFTAAEGSGAMYPSSTAERLPQGLALLEFVGLMVGKALYEGILLDLCLAPFFITAALQGRRPGLDDLATCDPQLHRSALMVKGCDDACQLEALGLTFSTEQNLLGQTIEYELLPGQGDSPVTQENKLLYVQLLADWHLSARLGPAAAAFARGISQVIPLSWFGMFSAAELNQLISGGQGGGLDVEDMQRYAVYSNGYSESSSTIKHFWKVVAGMSPAQRGALLRFITSTSRAPLGGFQHLQPPLTIHKVECHANPLALIGAGRDVDRLPSASTCYNMLKLPNYRRAATLKEKLLYAIQSGAGFELS